MCQALFAYSVATAFVVAAVLHFHPIPVTVGGRALVVTVVVAAQPCTEAVKPAGEALWAAKLQKAAWVRTLRAHRKRVAIAVSLYGSGTRAHGRGRRMFAVRERRGWKDKK